MTDKIRVTVFTPTFNRADTLHRGFESLSNQTCRDFKWLIIDDGSTDNTKEVVDGFIAQKPFFEIKYVYQPNQGKHVAKNNAVKLCDTEFFITLDSDDVCIPETIETFLQVWETIPDDEKPQFYGVSCRDCDEDGNIIGTPMPWDTIDCNDLDFKLKYGIKGDLWGMVRTDVMRQYLAPETPGLKYYPESIMWNKIGEKYKSRYFNKGMLTYIKDRDNSVTNKGQSRKAPSKEKYFMHLHYINDCWEYHKYDRKRFAEHLVAVTRDGKANGKSIKSILSDVNTPYKRALTLAFAPVGLALYRKGKG